MWQAGRRGRPLLSLRLVDRLSHPNPGADPGEARGAVGSARLAGGVQCSGFETGRLRRPSWAGTLFNNGRGPSANTLGIGYRMSSDTDKL